MCAWTSPQSSRAADRAVGEHRDGHRVLSLARLSFSCHSAVTRKIAESTNENMKTFHGIAQLDSTRPHNSFISGVTGTMAKGGEGSPRMPAAQPHVWGGLEPPPQHAPNIGGNDRALPRRRDALRRKCPSPWGPDERDLKPCHVSAVLAQGGPPVPGQGHHRVPASPRRLGSGSGSERGSLSGQPHETATQGEGSGHGLLQQSSSGNSD